MASTIENNVIYIQQGDTTEITVNNIPTDKNYQVYFAIQNNEREPIGNEIMVESLMNDSVILKILSSLSDLLTVPLEQSTEKYLWGIKLCSEEDLTEETVLNGQMIVSPKRVEGLVNE